MPRVKPRPVPAPLPDRPGRWKLLMRRQRRMLRPTAFASIAFCVLFAGVITVHLVGQGASMRDRLGHAAAGIGLEVRNIVIEGREKTPDSLLRTALGAVAGDPILSFSVDDARMRIEALTWVRSAVVERMLPDTIRVVLTERRPFAVWQNQGKFALIDRAGNIVTDSDIQAFADKLPLVVGAGAPLAAAALIDSMVAYPDLTQHMVAAVRVGERRWNLCMSSGADVLLPEGAEPPALAKLAELQTTKAILDRPLQEIDLRLPDRLRVRPVTQQSNAEGSCSDRRETIPLGRATGNPARKAT